MKTLLILYGIIITYISINLIERIWQCQNFFGPGFPEGCHSPNLGIILIVTILAGGIFSSIILIVRKSFLKKKWIILLPLLLIGILYFITTKFSVIPVG